MYEKVFIYIFYYYPKFVLRILQHPVYIKLISNINIQEVFYKATYALKSVQRYYHINYYKIFYFEIHHRLRRVKKTFIMV